MELKDFISSKNVALVVKQLPAEDSVDSTLFPSKKVSGVRIENAKGSKQKTVAIKQSTFDVAAENRALSANLTVESTDMPFFKESITMDETTRRNLMQAIMSNNQNLVDYLLGEVFQGYVGLVKAAKVKQKAMRAMLVQNGYINIKTPSGDVVMDYGVPAKHREVITSEADKWTNSSADIVGDLKRYQKAITDDQFAKPHILLMTETCFDNTIAINDAITAHMLNTNLNVNRILTQADYLQFVKQFCGFDVVFLDNTSTYIPYEGAAEVRHYEDNKIVLLNSTQLGNLVCGTTPEEFDKISGMGKLDTTVIEDGIAITSLEKGDPVTYSIKVSCLCLPSFDKAEEVFYATVY